MASVNMGDMMAIMKDLPKFADQAKDLIAKVKALTLAVDELNMVGEGLETTIEEDYDAHVKVLDEKVMPANNELKLALAKLPRLPNVIEG